MFEFKNKHRSKLEIDTYSTREKAVSYSSRMIDAFEVLSKIESLLSDVDIEKKGDSDIIFQTGTIKGKDFAIRLLFVADSDEPVAAKIIKR
jgi:hypothetical protein